MSRAASVTDRALLTRLAGVFRAEGYAGASLTALSGAAGLQRASLYHRFPGGKPAMASAVLVDVDSSFAEVLDPLQNVQPPAEAVAEMARRVASAYANGRMSCVLDTMTLDGAPEEVKAQAADLAYRWLDAMAKVAARSGLSEGEANLRARAALVSIEGALVVSRVLDDPSEFDRVLASLPALLTESSTTHDVGRGTDR